MPTIRTVHSYTVTCNYNLTKPQSLIRSIKSLQQMLESEHEPAYDFPGLFDNTIKATCDYSKENEIKELDELSKKLTQINLTIGQIIKETKKKKIGLVCILIIWSTFISILMNPRYGLIILIIFNSSYFTLTYSTTMGNKKIKEQERQMIKILKDMADCIENPEIYRTQKILKEKTNSR